MAEAIFDRGKESCDESVVDVRVDGDEDDRPEFCERAVVRQAQALGERYDGERLFAALEEECRAKRCGTKLVKGFVS